MPLEELALFIASALGAGFVVGMVVDGIGAVLAFFFDSIRSM